jgi:hypothetical protein
VDGAVDLFLFQPLLAGNRAVPVPVLVTVVVLVDVAVIKLVAALNPCKAEGYRGAGRGRSLFTSGTVDVVVVVDVDVDAGRLQQPVLPGTPTGGSAEAPPVTFRG